MIKSYHLLIAIVLGIGVGYFMNSPKEDNSKLKNLEKDVAYQELRAKQASDSAKMFLKSIQELSHKVAIRDSATDKKIKYETVILHHYDNAPSSKLDSFLRARYPDSITVARRSDR